MRRNAWLWVGFGGAVLISVALVVGLLVLILGPWGPPPPWAGLPAARTPSAASSPAVTTATPTVEARPTSPATSPAPSPAATAPPTEAPPTAPVGTPSTSPYPELTPSAPEPTPYPQAGDGTETARRIAAATLPERDLVALASVLHHGGQPIPRTATPDTQPFVVGRQDRFWLHDSDLNQYREISATLHVITPHTYVYLEDRLAVDQAALEAAAQFFEDTIYPACQETFGSEWTPGVDDDPHLVILNAALQGGGGYFYSLNELPRQVNSYSNQREMFSIDAADSMVGGSYYLSTLAHEFQHMIHWSRDPRTDTWVAEGLAQMAEQVAGFDPSTITWAFLDDTDVQLTTWANDPDTVLPHYAASYLWFRYLSDRTGGPSALRSLLDPERDDMAAIEKVLEGAAYQPALAAPRLFDAFFADWAVANYLNDPLVSDGRYAYGGDLDPGLLWATETLYSLPWQTSTTVRPYGTDYIEVQSLQRGPLRISFDGAETLPLADTAPHSGTHFWWSNRGDQADTSLTRAFDLSAVSRATLRCWLWYDIEKDYDYAYLMASADGGTSWSIVPGTHSTIGNPNGNNLGAGYTGTSGGGSSPRWVQEEFDLTAFAGRQVLVRFELVTDDAYNSRGLFVDDVEIPEIGFSDDMEGEAGWQPRGFVWTDNVVPLNFLVQIIQVDSRGQTTVQAMPLDGAQRGEVILAGYGSDVYQATLVISAVAPATTEPAPYTISLALE